MRDVKNININDLNGILTGYYGGGSISIRRIWCGRGPKDLHVVNLGPGGILDMLLDVGEDKEDMNEKSGNCWKYKAEFLILNRRIHMSPRAILIREKEGCVTWLEPCEK